MKYQDYVIKDGTLIGNFEEMYHESSKIPWHQDETAYAIFSDLDIVILKNMQKSYNFQKVADIACGLGYFTQRVADEVLIENNISGFDISETAVKQANQRFPQISFQVLDILKKVPLKLKNAYDLVICKECHWYVLHQLDYFQKQLLDISSAYVYICQSFPENDTYLGKEVFPNPETLLSFWSKRCEVIYTNIETDQKYGNRSLIHIFLKKELS
jgi:SAM-dependent methyltransferase